MPLLADAFRLLCERRRDVALVIAGDGPFVEEMRRMLAHLPAHFIGFVGTEPAGCLRVRFFGEFAKVERLAVRHQFRRSRVSFKLVQASVDYVKRKGFKKIYGQAQDRLVDFWAHFGAKPLGHNRKITFSDFSYTEMVLDVEPGPDAITLDSDPYVIIRPEGDWDRPGVLDISSGRATSSPLRTAALAET